MQLVLGLGNPGPRYADTRHNVGFRCVEAVAARLGLTFDNVCTEYRTAVGEGPAGPLTLLQPLTYMNRSGLAVLAWAGRTGFVLTPAPNAGEGDESPTNLPVPIVVCDDLHLPLGSIRIRGGGSDGGQNGLASVIEVVERDDLPRLRLGVGPLDGILPPESWADYVLAEFPPDETEAAADLIEHGADALLDLVAAGPAAAASRHNRRIRPSPPLPGDVQ